MITFFIAVQLMVVGLISVMLIACAQIDRMSQDTMTDFDKEVERITNQDGV